MREQEKEKSEVPKRNRKKKNDSPERKSDRHERKFNYLAKVSEVRKVLLACEPLYLLYCKDSTISTDNSNELTISISPSVEPLLQEFKDVFPKEIPLGLPPSRGIKHQIDLLLGASLPNKPSYKSNPQETQHKDAQAKVKYVKRFHDQVKAQIAKKNESYAKQANKNRKEVVLEPGDWVCVHMKNERFYKQRNSKLQPRGDGPFQVLERINDNAYKIDIPGEYGVGSSFNVADLTPFVAGDDSKHLRANSFQEGGNDENPKTVQIQGPMTRSRTKQSMDTLQQKVEDILNKAQVEKDEGPSGEGQRPK